MGSPQKEDVGKGNGELRSRRGGPRLLLQNFSDLSKAGLPESQSLRGLLDPNSYCPVTFVERVLVSQILQCPLSSSFFLSWTLFALIPLE